ncbi:hypothetical protein ABZ671_01130 [Micromonospora sp. NPDC006766]|uniref:hypothetical protein n=1 Tax=Micromonospora sp. NPDC006766 TaxID=3154778 RepID=UPI0033FB2047
MDGKLDPRDVAALRMLAGANFLGGQVTLPSGRVLDPEEVQALTSAYAPAVGEVEEVARAVGLTAREIADTAADMAGRMPREGESMETRYLASGGDPGSDRTRAILREADRGRARRARRAGSVPQVAARSAEPKNRIDNDIKQGAFVITGLYALAFIAGVVLFAVTGETGLMVGAVALFGLTVLLVATMGGLWWLARRLFPDGKV